MIRAALIAAICCLAAPALANDKPSIFFCWTARAAVAAAGSEKAAEREARARGISEVTIAKAKRCPR